MEANLFYFNFTIRSIPICESLRFDVIFARINCREISPLVSKGEI